MIRKISTSITLISISIIVVTILCFGLGCKIPQFDIHKKWTTLEANNDSEFSIEKVSSAYVMVNLGIPEQFICYGDSVKVISESGAIKYIFKTKNEDILIDKNNNRLIEQATTFAKWKVVVDSAFVIDLQNFNKKRVEVVERIVSETYKAYKKRLNIEIEYSVTNAKEFILADSICTVNYLASQTKYVEFLKTLQPVIQLDNKYGGRNTSTVLYSNNKGTLFTILSSDFITSNNLEDYMRSLDKLWPKWNYRDYEYLAKFKNGNFSISDKSRVTGNELDVDWWHSRIGFDQNYVNYYAIKLKDSVLNFKVFDNTHITYLEKNLSSFQQLNVPKSDKDTLAFVYGKNLYRAYLKDNVIKAK